MLRKFKHENVVTLIDVYCKVEDSQGSTGIFPWFEAIEEEPITWIYEDGSSKSQKVSVLKFYIVLQYCPWTLQTVLDGMDGKRLPIDRTH